MKFHMYESQENSLYHDALEFAGISDSSQFPLTQFTRNANAWYRKADSWIWEATGTWEFDDSNWTTLPIAVASLVAGRQDYEIPSTARKIDRVEILDSGSNYHVLTPFDKSQVRGSAMSEFYETDGLPALYDMVGRSIMLYPAPAAGRVTLVEGIKVYYARDIDEFGIADTNTEPGFDSHFHRIISLGAAYDYCISNDPERIKPIRIELSNLKTELTAHYGVRHRDLRPRMIPVDSDGI